MSTNLIDTKITKLTLSFFEKEQKKAIENIRSLAPFVAKANSLEELDCLLFTMNGLLNNLKSAEYCSKKVIMISIHKESFS